MPQLLAAFASIKRIESYLAMDEREIARREDGDDGNLQASDSDEKAGGNIALLGASFTWAADQPPFLGPISIELSSRHLHVCTGPVASVRFGTALTP
jgi:ATP-binding cassette subfamily C (CFTR/MRP) protein 1